MHTQGEVDALKELLTTVQWAPKHQKPTVPFKIVCASSPTAPASTLSAQLNILRSVKPADSVHRVRVRLQGFDMTRDVMAALHGLPHWVAILNFSSCTWPLPAGRYRELAHNVPTSYNV